MSQLSNNKHINKEIRIPRSEIRILLWDIDGTLLRSSRNGAYKDYFAPSLTKVFGTHGCLDSIFVSGMTDLEIAHKALCDVGVTSELIHERRSQWVEIYELEMQRVISEVHSWIVLNGVREILEVTHNHRRYRNALLTGNITTAAKLKLTLLCSSRGTRRRA